MKKIRINKYITLVVVMSAFTALITGCGGGSKESGVKTGRFALNVLWPAKGRLIPDASNSIKAELMSGTTLIASQILARPATGGQSTVTFNGIPPGDVVLNASAYPSVNGTGVAQAAGSAAATIVVDQTASVSVTMATTIDHIDVTPLNLTLEIGKNFQLIATAKDGPTNSSHVVLVTPGNLEWDSDNIAALTVSTTGFAHAVDKGIAKITVKDKESGKTGSTLMTASPPEGGVCVVTSHLFILGLGDSTNTNQIGQHSICAVGRLTTNSFDRIHVGDQPSDITKTPNGNFIYISLLGENKIAGFRVDPTKGLVSALPFGKISSGSKPLALAVDASGQNLYVTNSGDNSITSYSIGSDGSLIQIGVISTPAVPGNIVIDRQGKYAYVTTPSDNHILLYLRNADGTLNSTVSQSITLPSAPTDLAANPTTDFLYSSLNNSSVAQFSIGSDGTAQALTPPTAAPGVQPAYIRIDKTGTLMYAVFNPGLSAPGSIVSLKINSDGTLSKLSEQKVSTLNGPTDLQLEDNGVYATVLDANSNNFSLFKRSADGALLPSTYYRTAFVGMPIKSVSITF